MCGYTKELMMAIVVGGTALLGLTPILFKQIAESSMEVRDRLHSLRGLTISLTLSIFVVLFALVWLSGPSTVRWFNNIPWNTMASFLFGVDLGIFLVVAVKFFCHRCKEIEKGSKPATRATRSKRPRKRAPAR